MRRGALRRELCRLTYRVQLLRALGSLKRRKEFVFE